MLASTRVLSHVAYELSCSNCSEFALSSTTLVVYEKLLDRFGPQQWWPGESPLEVMVGAVLVQNTSWRNVERAIDNLREANALAADRLLAMNEADLEDLIRPAGYFRRKTKRLRSLMEFFLHTHGGSMAAMRTADSYNLREQLLAVHGIGPETADAILLYALEKPVMVVDTYTHRVFARHGWISYDADYHQLQEHLTSELPEDVQIYNELHALFVKVGKDYCRPTPRCDGCPLQELLPANGIVEAEY